MRLYFIRHGKTEWNLEARYQGAGGDSPLLPQSYREMNEVADYLSHEQFQHVYASPIKRAAITGRTIHNRINPDLPFTLMSRLEEFHLGKMEGMTFKAVEEQFPTEFSGFRIHPDQYDPTAIGGESFEELIARMTPGIKQIVAKYPKVDDKVIIVSHGAALAAEINALLAVPLAHLRDRGGLSNTSLTILETLDGGQSFRLETWNDTDFLTRHLDVTDTI